MQLRIENIGSIGSAVIDLTGLTIIGGLNDTGKSTIGKVYFAIIKAIRNREQEHANSVNNRINIVISELTSELRRILGARISPSLFDFTTRILSDIAYRGDNIQVDIVDHEISNLKGYILGEINRKVFRNNVDEQQLLFRLEQDNQEVLNAIDSYLSRIKEILLNRTDKKDIYADSFSRIMNYVFYGDINNKRSTNLGSITISENEHEVFSSSFRRNVQISFNIEEEALTDFFSDATILESPMVLSYGRLGNYLFDGPGDAYYYGDYPSNDLTRKLKYASNNPLITPESGGLEREINNIIAKTINGTIAYDDKQNDFIYSTDDDIKVRISNTASGVKALGIMQMLVKAGLLNGANLLVIDEPEVHLHPDWQIVYAEVIAILVRKYNIYCLVSSHSPYFIQAIEAYSKIYEMKGLTKFYISEKQESMCVFRDITEDPEPLYKLLADPMKRIAFLRAKAENE